MPIVGREKVSMQQNQCTQRDKRGKWPHHEGRPGCAGKVSMGEKVALRIKNDVEFGLHH